MELPKNGRVLRTVRRARSCQCHDASAYKMVRVHTVRGNLNNAIHALKYVEFVIEMYRYILFINGCVYQRLCWVQDTDTTKCAEYKTRTQPSVPSTRHGHDQVYRVQDTDTTKCTEYKTRTRPIMPSTRHGHDQLCRVQDTDTTNYAEYKI